MTEIESILKKYGLKMNAIIESKPYNSALKKFKQEFELLKKTINSEEELLKEMEKIVYYVYVTLGSPFFIEDVEKFKKINGENKLIDQVDDFFLKQMALRYSKTNGLVRSVEYVGALDLNDMMKKFPSHTVKMCEEIYKNFSEREKFICMFNEEYEEEKIEKNVLKIIHEAKNELENCFAFIELTYDLKHLFMRDFKKIN